MLFGVIFAHKRYPFQKYFYVFMIVVGMAIFLMKENRNSKHDYIQFGRGEAFLVNRFLNLYKI